MVVPFSVVVALDNTATDENPQLHSPPPIVEPVCMYIVIVPPEDNAGDVYVIVWLTPVEPAASGPEVPYPPETDNVSERGVRVAALTKLEIIGYVNNNPIEVKINVMAYII